MKIKAKAKTKEAIARLNKKEKLRKEQAGVEEYLSERMERDKESKRERQLGYPARTYLEGHLTV